MNENRLKNILAAMKRHGLSQILICDPLSIFYLTGHLEYTGERFYGLYLNEAGRRVLFLHEMFLGPEASHLEIVKFKDTDDLVPIISPHLTAGDFLGVDKDMHARFLLPLMAGCENLRFVIGSLPVDEVRGIKDSREIVLMEEASCINDHAMELIKKEIVPGITEAGLSEKLSSIYRELGAEGFSFDPLIAFGPHAAEPHHSSDHTPLKSGDCIIFDMGCRKDGYCSDMTRTFFYQKVDAEEEQIYKLVLNAHNKAVEAVKPGIPIRELDRVARGIITDAGYGECFNHRLGHFIGMEVHEFGDISEKNSELLKEGMIFSIEPGIYLKGKTGVRIEDLVVVTSDGCRRLNNFPRQLEVVG